VDLGGKRECMCVHMDILRLGGGFVDVWTGSEAFILTSPSSLEFLRRTPSRSLSVHNIDQWRSG
jgi:hypothetical protein